MHCNLKKNKHPSIKSRKLARLFGFEMAARAAPSHRADSLCQSVIVPRGHAHTVPMRAVIGQDSCRKKYVMIIAVVRKQVLLLFSGIIQLLSGSISSESIPLYTNRLSINGVKITDIKFDTFCIKKLRRTTLLSKCKPFWNSIYLTRLNGRGL